MQHEPRISPRTEQTLRVSAKLITASTILQLSSDELERTINQEQMENPALEVAEQRICHFCGTRLHGQTCTNCGHTAPSTRAMSEASLNYDTPANLASTHLQFYDFDNPGFAEIDRDDEFDMLATIPNGETLSEVLFRQLEALISSDDELIAKQLVGNLNERGYLEISTSEIASYLQVPLERVEYVLSLLHTLEPLGIGARDLRECLLIQLQALSEQEAPPLLAHTMIDQYFGKFGRGQFAEIARDLKVSEQEVRQASLYISSKLYPFPAHTYHDDIPATHRSYTGTTYIRPDILIRTSENGFEIELIESKRYTFAINPTQALPSSSNPATPEVQRYLRPLTRAEVAKALNLDEGTVSRATANKYALLPNGRLIPLSDFFDSSLSVKDILKELIATEDPRKRLSDDELAKLMQARGIPMARRTVTKYREEIGIGSSRERR